MSLAASPPKSVEPTCPRIWLVEDNAAYRASLTRAVALVTPSGQVRAFGDCEDALAALGAEPAPEALLLDLGLPGMGGLEGLPRFKEKAPGMRILVITSFDDHDHVFKAVCAGASGYLLKSASLGRVTEAIREVLAGGAPMSPLVASAVLGMFAELGRVRPAPPEYGLSPRELETLGAMVEGITAKEIAARLNVSYHTVDTYIRNIYSKLHVQSRGSAISKALRERIL